MEDLPIADDALPLVVRKLELAVDSAVTGNNAFDASKFKKDMSIYDIALSTCQLASTNNQASNDNDVADGYSE